MITTIGIFSTQTDAESSLRELRAFGVLLEDISYVYSKNFGKSVGKKNKNNIVQSVENDASAGMIVGTVLGFAVASGILPGIGSFLVAGPLALAFGVTPKIIVGETVTGTVAGGFVGALMSFGINAGDSIRFQDYVKSGDILVIVRIKSSEIKNILMRTHAREVQEYTQ